MGACRDDLNSAITLCQDPGGLQTPSLEVMKTEVFLSFIPKLQVRTRCAASPAVAPGSWSAGSPRGANTGAAGREPVTPVSLCAGRAMLGMQRDHRGGKHGYTYCRLFYTVLYVVFM